VTIGAISRFAIALRLVQLPGFNATDTTDSEPPKSAVTVVAWKQPLGRAPFSYTYCKADPRRGTPFFFRFGFSSIRDTSFLTTLIQQQLLLPAKRTHDHYQQ
jgi:hypothetical protein